MKNTTQTNAAPFPGRAPGRPGVLCALVLLALMALLSPAFLSQAQAQGFAPAPKLSAKTLAQIAALQTEKAGRNKAQRKMDSQLIYADKQRRNVAIKGAPKLRVSVRVTATGRVLVDLKATVTPALLRQIANVGGTVVNSHARYQAIRAWLPLSKIEALAGRSDVKRIQRADIPLLSGDAGSRAAGLRAAGSREARRTNNGAQLAAWLQARRAANPAGAGPRGSLLAAASLDGGTPHIVPGPIVNSGSVTSQGDVTHAAASARTTFGVDGTGVKVGVLSDSADHLAESQASGDLGPVTVLPGQVGSGAGEGTAMLEIVHDLAPGAQLFFATATSGAAQMAQNIRDLRTAGCDIIIDDVSYGDDDSPFQDGVISQAVSDVSAAGCLYFSSTANSGNKNDGTSGTWEGDFVDGGDATGDLAGAGRVHDFGGGVTANPITSVSSNATILYWSDARGASANDYDLYVLDAGGSLVGGSTSTQDGTQDPFEAIAAPTAGQKLVVVKFLGAARCLHIDTNRARLSISTQGSTRGHNASGAANAFCVAATNVANSFPNAFSGGATNPVETFSSDGPRRIFYNANGTAITPGNVLAGTNGGTVLQKPDITAADGANSSAAFTGASGLNPFFGTSAAAPHAGAVAALLKSFQPALTPAQMRAVLTSTALDIEAAGVDRDSGAGIVMANRALAAVNGTHLFYQSSVVDPTGGNANGTIDPNECNLLNVTLRASLVNSGPFTNISATPSSATTGVTIAQPASSYPNIPSLGTGTNTTPFRLTTSAGFVPGTTINFTLAVTYTGGSDILNFTVETGQTTPTVITGSLTAGDPTQTGRLARDGVVPTCGSSKTNGLTTGTGARAYDSYTFTNGNAPTCVTVTLDNPSFVSGDNSTQIFGAAYLGSFNPANPTANYLGDMGGSATSTTMAVDVGANQTLVVVVHVIDPGDTHASYTLTVSGLISTATGSGPCPTPQTYQVNVTADDSDGSCDPLATGDCTLREAINASNTSTNLHDTISFAIGSGAQTINTTSALPAITDAVTIDGSTQPGAAALPRITLNGTGAGAGVDGLTLTTGSSAIGGLGIQNFGGRGVVVNGSNNVVGLALDGSGAANKIWNNTGAGIAVLGAANHGNVLRGNSLRGNAIPIDLNNDGVTNNDAGDGDGDPNNRQNFPVLTSAMLGFGGTNTMLTGTLNSKASRSYRLDFYRGTTTGGVSDANSTGTFYLGSTTVSTNGSGNLASPFSFDTGAASSGVSYAATATDTTTGDTSEFSALLQQDGVRPTISITAPNPAGGALMVGQNFPQIGGGATDNLPGVTVRLNLIRVSDGFYWNGATFVPTPTAQTNLPTTAGGVTWNSTGPLPLAGSTLTDNKYQIVAYAIDTSGNQSVASKTLSYDPHLPTVSISTPGTGGQLSGVTVNVLNLTGGVSGSSAHTGVGIKKVLLKLTRNSDNFQWNGTTWVSGAGAAQYVTVVLDAPVGSSPAAWHATGALPTVGASTTTQLQVGKVYNLSAVATDMLDQASNGFLLRVKIVSSLSVFTLPSAAPGKAPSE